MEYCIIRGYRGESKLVYVPKEKYLYLKKNERSGNRTYICYQKVLLARERKYEDHTKCNAVVIIDKQGNCWKGKSHHTSHQNHRSIYNDLISLNSMKDTCQFLHDKAPASAHKIPLTEIIATELKE